MTIINQVLLNNQKSENIPSYEERLNLISSLTLGIMTHNFYHEFGGYHASTARRWKLENEWL